MNLENDNGLLPPKIGVLVPCFNEQLAIEAVVAGFRAALPDATIYVYDNNSTDRTIEVAQQAGAVVRSERLQGKGHVIRRMFADIEADIYVLVDGDGTYDAAAAQAMVAVLADDGLDMVNGARVSDTSSAYRAGHRFGNAMLTRLIGAVFGHRVADVLSGYRVFSRRFVKSFPALSQGFETETELTVHALALHMPIAELPTTYRERQSGSVSKLRTYRDGLRILRTIVVLIKEERPLPFFCVTAATLLILACGLGAPVVAEFLRTGLVPRLPTAVLATGIVLLAFLSLACGLILDSVARGRREFKRLAYLAVPTMRRREAGG